MQVDILQFYLLNLMTAIWGKCSGVTMAQGGREVTHNDLGSYWQIQALGNPLKFLLCDRKSSFLHMLPVCPCPLPSCLEGQNREADPGSPVETGDQKSEVTAI